MKRLQIFKNTNNILLPCIKYSNTVLLQNAIATP